MPFGLFGKVPQKRDFLVVNLPDAILHPFETWLQTSLAASRSTIGRRWEEFYLVAPIWRFWIGPGVFGVGCAGAMAPSVDAVGRYFPLAIVHWDAAATTPLPLLDPAEPWYGAIDDRLLKALSEGEPDYLETLLEGLNAPPSLSEPDPARTIGVFRDGIAFTPAGNGTVLQSALPALRDEDYAAAAAGRSYWWSKAPSGPILYAGAGLPEADRFARMLLWTR
ncbi:type VI secretion system-associated protein TagF [Devosia nitrariae]|uniref:Type VI secretion-associated protein n=1 Tax=Devosia nitrariae TaxID=2071872 RepID=A0ABQ5WEW6_9HYPH|nr:type VI secretion system-associated protein TagF [Devosia nitrariae]GLQ58045.1 type VI secretion-associated protein [Devosia nitrariae]